MASDKDTIYIDIDDEITGIIEKLKGSSGKVVALVLPKRATVFQSIVNMKLLKRAAEANKKNVVLITAESGLLPLAGVAGVHVAKTLTSKPEIPDAPGAFDDTEEAISEDGEAVDTPPDPQQSIGDLAEAAAKPASADGVETLMLDDDALPPEDDAAKPGSKSFEPPKKGKGKNKKLKVPNFERFRLLIILGVVALILLIAGFIFANATLPKAIITIKTNANNVAANVTLNLSTTATSLDPASGTIPAKLVQQQKTYTASEVTTGQKNNGNVASGSVAMSAKYCQTLPPNNGPADVPAGTGLSSNGLTYITQANTSFSSHGDFNGGCTTFKATEDTPIKAQTGGSSYNGANVFTVAGRSDVSANVSQAVTGGTDNIVQSVNQNDVNNAKAKISSANNAAMQQILQNQLQQAGYYPIGVTFQAGTPNISSSPGVGAIANSVTVTETITFTMFGVHRADLTTLVDGNVDTQIDTSKQSILDDGINKAVYNINNLTGTGAQIAMSVVAVAGPQLNVTAIKQEAEGQKVGPIQTKLQSNPNVTNVTVKLSPFWVTTIPKNPSRITVTIAKPTTTVNSNGSKP